MVAGNGGQGRNALRLVRAQMGFWLLGLQQTKGIRDFVQHRTRILFAGARRRDNHISATQAETIGTGFND
jgi:hypothetical protein